MFKDSKNVLSMLVAKLSGKMIIQLMVSTSNFGIKTKRKATQVVEVVCMFQRSTLVSDTKF